MKKSSLIISIIAIISSICFFGCGEPVEHNHTLVMVNRKEPTSLVPGYMQHYKCSGCDKLFFDVLGKNEISISDIEISTDKHKHNTMKIDAVNPTKLQEGNKEYYKCIEPNCNKIFRDKNAVYETDYDSIVIKKLFPEFITKEIKYQYEYIPDELSGCEEIILANYFVEGKTSAFKNEDKTFPSLPYIYLKREVLVDFVIEFEVYNPSVYNFGVTIFPIPSLKKRVTNIKIDDSEFLTLSYQHEEDKVGVVQYASGFSAYLDVGVHKVSFSLDGTDFDDNIVKSLFLRSFLYSYE